MAVKEGVDIVVEVAKCKRCEMDHVVGDETNVLCRKCLEAWRAEIAEHAKTQVPRPPLGKTHAERMRDAAGLRTPAEMLMLWDKEALANALLVLWGARDVALDFLRTLKRNVDEDGPNPRYDGAAVDACIHVLSDDNPKMQAERSVRHELRWAAWMPTTLVGLREFIMNTIRETMAKERSFR